MTRRAFLGAGLGTVLASCGGEKPEGQTPTAGGGQEAMLEAPATLQPPTSTRPARAPTVAPTPLPRGSEERALLPATPWEARLVVRRSGRLGPVVMVLGGVHGNEPGGWLAAEEIARWEPLSGTLLIVPRANVQAVKDFVRTTDDLGDLNRLYPGDPNSRLPMERMAAAILGAASEWKATLLLDLHESWAFWAEYPPNSGTGALGQTITTGAGPLAPDFGRELADRVNPQVSKREQMIVRDGSPFSRPTATPGTGQSNRGRSSLSAGGHVSGLTPVLVEMGQQNQELERRVDLHLIVARQALELVGSA